MACGFVLVDYGFNLIASGLPGAKEFTSQFLGVNLLVGGSALVFGSLYYLLKPATPAGTVVPQPVLGRPDVGVETVVEEQTPPKPGFYKGIEYVGYFFAFLGLISAADLVLQVFIHSIYNEARWWVEVLLVVFGVLSYTIFGSIGRLGAQEEAKLTAPISTPVSPPKPPPQDVPSTQIGVPAPSPPASTEPLTVNPAVFTRSSTGDFERHLSGDSYDMFHAERDIVTVWREDRKGIRSTYLAGPYELSRDMLEECVKNGQELKIGALILSPDAARALLEIAGETGIRSAYQG